MDVYKTEQLSRLALQTWTIRRELRSNAENVHGRVHKLGVQHLELGGTDRSPPSAFSKMCARHGFEVIGLHEPSLVSDSLDLLLDEVRSRCEVFGAKLVVTWFGHDKRSSYDTYSRYADLCVKAGRALKQDGVALCYHCYDFDLKPLGKNCEDKSGVDVLFEKTADEDLLFELDTFFLYKAQCSLEAALAKYGRRCRLVHVDDIDERGLHAPLGAGLTPWAEVIKLIRTTCSVEWFILEHESHAALKWIAQSIHYWEGVIVPIIKELTRNGEGRDGEILSQ